MSDADSLPPAVEASPSGELGIVIPANQRRDPISAESLLHYGEEILLIAIVLLVGVMARIRRR